MKRRTVIYVPIVTPKQLRTIDRIVGKLQRLGAEFDEHWRNLEASLSVLNSDNQPDGWKKVRVRKETVRQKAKKAI